MSEDPASKDFVDRAVRADRDLTVAELAAAEKLTDEKFRSRDLAINVLTKSNEALSANRQDRTTNYVAVAGLLLAAIGTLLALLAFAGRH